MKNINFVMEFIIFNGFQRIFTLSLWRISGKIPIFCLNFWVALEKFFVQRFSDDFDEKF